MTYESNKKIVLIQIFLIFILPVFLIYFNILAFSWRYVFLSIGFLLIYGILKKEKWTFKEMGFRIDNFKKAFSFYLIFIILGILVLFLIKYLSNLPDIDNKNFLIRTWIFFLPVSFFQEFAFRSFLIPRLKILYQSKLKIIFINTLLFTLIHVIYPNLVFVLPLTFIAGFLFAYLYYQYPNLILISIAHAILNLSAVLLGFFGSV